MTTKINETQKKEMSFGDLLKFENKFEKLNKERQKWIIQELKNIMDN